MPPELPTSAEMTAADHRQPPGESRAASLWSRVGPVGLALAAYVVAALIGFWHAWTSDPSQHALSGGGDQAASMWFLTWAPYSIAHWHNPLFSEYGNFPYGVNLMANTSTLPLGFLVAPVTLFFGPVVSFDLLGTLAPILSASAAYLLIRRFTTWRPAAFVGGLLYGFSPYMVAQGIGHLNLVFVPIPPLILLMLHDVVARQRGRPVIRGLVLGLLMTVQFFMSSEILLGTLVIGGVGLVLACLFARSQVRVRAHYAVVALLSAGGVSLVLLAYPVWFLFAGPAHIVGPIQTAAQDYRADLLGPIFPDSLQHFAPATFANAANRFAGNGTENGSYIGLPLLVLLVVSVVSLWRILIVRIAGILGALAFVLSLGSRLVVDNHVTGLVLPEAIFDRLPLFKNAVPSRYSLYVVLCAAVVLAMATERLRGASFWRNRAAAVGAPAVMCVAILIPLLPAWPYNMEPTGVPTYFTSGAANAIPANTVALIYPFPDANFANPQNWQASTFLRFKIAGGRFIVPQEGTGAVAPSRPSLTDDVLTALAQGSPPQRTGALRSRVDAQLRSWHVTSVVAIPTGSDPAQAIAFLTWLLGRAPTQSSGAYTWYHWS